MTGDMTGDMGMTGTDYSWSDCAKDLALRSQLTISQSADLTTQLARRTQLTPYDTFTVLDSLLIAIRQNSYEELGAILAKLINLNSEGVRFKALQK